MPDWLDKNMFAAVNLTQQNDYSTPVSSLLQIINSVDVNEVLKAYLF